MKWFGPYWDAPVTDDPEDRIATPDTICFLCEVGFTEEDRGLRFVSGEDVHLRCHMRSVLGEAEADRMMEQAGLLP